MRGISCIFGVLAAVAVVDARAEPVAWASRPTPAQIAQSYPRVARDLGLEGRVELRCRATNGPMVGDCSVRSETPEGLGFGAAALGLAPLYRTGPTPTAAIVDLPVDFAPPRAPAAPIVPPPTSPAALDLAHRLLLEPGGLREGLELAAEDEAARLRLAPGVTDEVKRRAADAYLTAAKRRIPDWVGAAAAIHAAYETADELRANLAFRKSATGQDYTRHEAELQAAFSRAARHLIQAEMQAARDQPCGGIDCGASPIPGDRPPPPGPKLALARQAAEIDMENNHVAATIDRIAERLEGAGGKDLAKAWRDKVPAALDGAKQEIALNYATYFSADELTEILAFERGPAGIALRRHEAELDAAFKALTPAYVAMIARDAGDLFNDASGR